MGRPKKESNIFYELKNNKYYFEIKWFNNHCKDLKKLSDAYANVGYSIANQLICKYNKNCMDYTLKEDIIYYTFSGIYSFQLSIELLLKAIIAKFKGKNSLFQNIQKNRHNIYNLFLYVKSNLNILDDKCIYLEKYLENMCSIDSQCTLFRYPDIYKYSKLNKNIDVYKTFKNLLKCYNVLEKIFNKEDFNDMDEDNFLYFNKKNCINGIYLDFYGIEYRIMEFSYGYYQTAKMLFSNIDNTFDNFDFTKSFPIIFFMRNAIELIHKNIILQHNQRVNNKKELKNHNNKDLLKTIEKFLKEYFNYADFNNPDTKLKTYLKEINALEKFDKNSYTFRYPFSKNLDYKLNNINLDLKNIFDILEEIFEFLVGINEGMANLISQEKEANMIENTIY